MKMSVEHAIFVLKENASFSDGEIEDATDMAIEALERTVWIPVSERLPEFYQKVLIIDETKTLNITRLCHLSDWELYGITHWMPLPNPPQEVE